MKLFRFWFAKSAQQQNNLAKELDNLRQRLFELEGENAHLRLVTESQSQLLEILTQHTEHLQAKNTEYQQALKQKEQEQKQLVSLLPNFRQN
jgi:regulator of replication initiation timing